MNFVFASVVCTRCIRNGSWKQDLEEECEICGRHRTYSWSHAGFTETLVNVPSVTENPLGDFLNWLLYNFLDKPFENVALSHFGVSIFFNIKMIHVHYNSISLTVETL